MSRCNNPSIRPALGTIGITSCMDICSVRQQERRGAAEMDGPESTTVLRAGDHASQ
jgi:hypothetical protein